MSFSLFHSLADLSSSVRLYFQTPNSLQNSTTLLVAQKYVQRNRLPRILFGFWYELTVDLLDPTIIEPGTFPHKKTFR
jgi:hypothetical protein